MEVHENFNAGWTATLNGRPLTAVRLDGWQQAFIVPAGQGGVIRLSYAPATVYHAGLIASALALVVLAVLAVCPRSGLAGGGPGGGWQPGRRGRSAASGPAHWTPLWIPTGRDSAAKSRTRPWGRRAARTAVVFVPLAVVIWLAGGPAALAVPALACLAWWRPRWLPPIAFGAMLIAGVAAASAGNLTALGSGAFGGLAQACALVALTAALMPEAARETPAERDADGQEHAA